MFQRPTRLEINLSTLINNYQIICRQVHPRPVMAVLKANAYGHGLVSVAKALIEQTSCQHIAVAYLDEALILREAGIKVSILVLGGIVGERVPLFIEHDISITASSVEKLKIISKHAQRMNKGALVHLKIDTGMERIGVHHYSAEPLFEAAKKAPMVQIEGVFSHFSHADVPDKETTMRQLDSFLKALPEQQELGMLHIANSGATLQYPETWLDMIRVGISMYGLSPGSEVSLLPGIRPAMRWVSKVVFFKVVPKGATVSYGGTWTAPQQTRIITIPVGYGDGYQRRMSGQAQVLIRGKRYPVVGSICMDQMMVDIGWDEVYNGEEVVLLGTQGEQTITVSEHAQWAGTINYEIICAINNRVPRIPVT